MNEKLTKTIASLRKAFDKPALKKLFEIRRKNIEIK